MLHMKSFVFRSLKEIQRSLLKFFDLKALIGRSDSISKIHISAVQYSSMGIKRDLLSPILVRKHSKTEKYKKVRKERMCVG